MTRTKTKDLNRLIRLRIVVTCILSFLPWRHRWQTGTTWGRGRMRFCSVKVNPLGLAEKLKAGSRADAVGQAGKAGAPGRHGGG